MFIFMVNEDHNLYICIYLLTSGRRNLTSEDEIKGCMGLANSTSAHTMHVRLIEESSLLSFAS